MRRKIIPSPRYCWSVALLLMASIGMVPSPCRAEPEAPVSEARQLLKRGTIEIGAAAGYWQAVSAPFHAYSANRSAVFIMPRIGMVVTDELKAGRLSGNLEVLIEPVFAQFTKPTSAQLAGGSFVVKYNFVPFGRWIPFWEAGAGLSWMNLVFPTIPEESERVNFLLQTGPGVQYLVTPHVSLAVGVRWSHISDADIAEKNAGLNAVLPYVGLTWFLPK
jgi:opacity protein-like surface antigen